MRFWRRRGRRADRASSSTSSVVMATKPSARERGGGGAHGAMVSSCSLGVSDAATTRDVEAEEEEGGDGGGAGAAFVKELREDGTLMRLERAAEALRRATMGKGGDEKTKALDAYLSRKDDEDAVATKTASKTVVFLDGGDDDNDDDDARYDSVLATLDDVSVTMRRLRLDSSSRSYSRSSDASVVENDIDAVPKTPKTPNTTPVPVLTRSLAMRRLRERHSEYSTDEIVVVAKRSEETRRNRASDSSSDSKGYTPPRRQCVATPRTSLDVLRRDTVDDGARISSHKSLENQLSTISSTSSSDRESPDAANAPRKPKKKPPTPYPLTKTLSARELDAATLTEKLRDALRDEPGVERQHDDVYAAALQRSLRSMSASTPTVGLCLLSRVDEIVHVIEGESTKHACFALELERSKVESMYRLSGYINAIPSKRLRDALLDMHKTALENIERQFHARMVAAQRRYLDSIVSDVRVSSRTPPSDLLGAFEYMCALCLDLNARDSRFHERFF